MVCILFCIYITTPPYKWFLYSPKSAVWDKIWPRWDDNYTVRITIRWAQLLKNWQNSKSALTLDVPAFIKHQEWRLDKVGLHVSTNLSSIFRFEIGVQLLCFFVQVDVINILNLQSTWWGPLSVHVCPLHFISGTEIAPNPRGMTP